VAPRLGDDDSHLIGTFNWDFSQDSGACRFDRRNSGGDEAENLHNHALVAPELTGQPMLHCAMWRRPHIDCLLLPLPFYGSVLLRLR
jgi:hypothetical protein